jgi:predicted  nucleic acid-binding Zn-ribbon protein
LTLVPLTIAERTTVIKEQRLRRELLTIQQRIRTLNLQLSELQAEVRYSSSPDRIEKARREETALLAELDRLMTRTRTIEGQLRPVYGMAVGR